ncbi:MAG: 3-hydroxyacyl-ACP dehydratase FabZ family protein [Bdellovibrionales bacterium]
MSNAEDATLILAAVPQRYPFLMVDRIVSHEFGKKAVCRKNVTNGEEILAGHFPGNPIFPGVLMVELSLQTTQVMLTDLQSLKNKIKDTQAPQGYLVSIDKFKFLKVIRPGDILEATSEFDMDAMGMTRAKVKITTDAGEDVAHGIVTVSSPTTPA